MKNVDLVIIGGGPAGLAAAVAARKGRNPRTGETVEVSAKYVPHFRAGKEVRDAMNESRESEMK